MTGLFSSIVESTGQVPPEGMEAKFTLAMPVGASRRCCGMAVLRSSNTVIPTQESDRLDPRHWRSASLRFLCVPPCLGVSVVEFLHHRVTETRRNTEKMADWTRQPFDGRSWPREWRIYHHLTAHITRNVPIRTFLGYFEMPDVIDHAFGVPWNPSPLRSVRKIKAPEAMIKPPGRC